jgi:hypothetical protein
MILRSESVCRHCPGFSRTRHDSGEWMFSCGEESEPLPASRFEGYPEPLWCRLGGGCVVMEDEWEEEFPARVPDGARPGALDIFENVFAI